MTETAKSKIWWHSKTMLFNLVVFAASLATAATPALEKCLSQDSYAVLVSAVALINAVLRLVTKEPIKGA